MIDHFALLLGHGLLALAMLRLLLRDGLDTDPLIGSIRDEAASNRAATSAKGRNAARQKHAGHEDPPEA